MIKTYIPQVCMDVFSQVTYFHIVWKEDCIGVVRLTRWSQSHNNNGFFKLVEALLQVCSCFFSHSTKPGPQPGVQGGRSPPLEIFSPPMEKCVGHSLEPIGHSSKILGPSQKNLRPSWCPMLVTGLYKTICGLPLPAVSLSRCITCQDVCVQSHIQGSYSVISNKPIFRTEKHTFVQ